MTWDVSRIKQQRHTDDAEHDEPLPGDDEALVGDPLASQQLADVLLKMPLPPAPPSLTERMDYEQQGLIHPYDVPMVQQAMSRGIEAVHGFAPSAEAWPVDMPEEELLQ